MTLWTLEWYRLVRTRRLLALVGVFAFFGFVGPLLAAYLEELVAAGGAGGMVVQTPDPTPAMAIEQFSSNAAQIGLLVAIVVAASALALDVRPELAAFFRTRVPDVGRLLLPRYLVTTAAVVGAFSLGAAAAWYETSVLIGAPDALGMLAGVGLTAAYLAFAMAVVALATSVARGVLGAVGATVVALLLLPLAAVVDVVAEWSPSALLGALPELAGGGDAGGYLRPLATTLVSTVALLALAARRLRTREV